MQRKTTTKKVDLRDLKSRVAKFSGHPIFKRVFAKEPDQLESEEFAGKVWTWLVLYEAEDSI